MKGPGCNVVDFSKIQAFFARGIVHPGLFSIISSTLQADDRPNVVVIITDDLNGYGFYGGYPGTRVPAMDRLKESAVTFQHAYTAAPVCGPSRAAFFSGLYPHTSGAYRNGADPWRRHWLISSHFRNFSSAAVIPRSARASCFTPGWPRAARKLFGITTYFTVASAPFRAKKTSSGNRVRSLTAAAASSGA